MLSNRLTIPHLSRWFAFFIFLHILIWALVPYFVRYSLPMDAMEGATWGHQLEWGYDKNPFLNGWLTALAVGIDNHSGLFVYFFSQLCVVIGFWSVWELGRKMLPPVHALIAVLLLESIQYYTVHAIDFNDNTLELALWPLLSLSFYNALKKGSLRDWGLTGLLAGLGMMAKYYTVMLLIPMLLFMIVEPTNRRYFSQSVFYVGLGVFLVVILPHLLWLTGHDFITVKYAMRRVSSQPVWINHFLFPWEFSWEQIQTFFPPLILFFLLYIGKKPQHPVPRVVVSTFDWRFLLFVGLGPFVLTVLLSSFTGIRLRAGWGAPLLSLWGILLITCLQPQITASRFYRFVIVCFISLCVTALFYAGALIRADAPSSANFPGQIIAHQLTREWHDTFHTPLSYVGGSRWFAGNVAFYSLDRPAVYIDWNPKYSPWINEADFRQKGAVFVWDKSEGKKYLLPSVLARFKALGPIKIMHFAWMRNPKTPPVMVTVAFLPPENTYNALTSRSANATSSSVVKRPKEKRIAP